MLDSVEVFGFSGFNFVSFPTEDIVSRCSIKDPCLIIYLFCSSFSSLVVNGFYSSLPFNRFVLILVELVICSF